MKKRTVVRAKRPARPRAAAKPAPAERERERKADCIFCRIVSGEVESKVHYQDDDVIAVFDVNPQAPIHILVIPRAHIPSLAEATARDKALLGHMLYVASRLAKREGLSERGYRLVLNTGADAGQEVQHLHLHILGRKKLGKMG